MQGLGNLNDLKAIMAPTQQIINFELKMSEIYLLNIDIIIYRSEVYYLKLVVLE